MVDITASLATDFIASQGWCCIHAAPQTAGGCLVIVGGIDDRNKPGSRIWFPRRGEADRVIKSFLSRCELASRRARGGLSVRTDTDDAARIIRDVVANYGYGTAGDAAIDDQLALVSKRIKAALERMQNDGSLKMLNRYYRGEREAARTNGTALPPKYDQWLADRLRPALRTGLG
jgi:hypothetical protein